MGTTSGALEFIIRANDDEFRSSISRMESNFRSGVQGMARAANAQANRINRALTGIQGFRALKRQIQETESQWQGATREVARLAREMGETETPTRQMTRAFEKAKRQAASFKEELNRQKESLHRMRGSLREAGVDTTRLGESQDRLQREMADATREVQEQTRVARAFGTLGVRSFRDVENEVQRLETAYRDLARSGRVSAVDLSRAHEQMQRRVRELRREMSGLDRSMGGMGTTVRNLVVAYAGFESVHAASGFIKDSILIFAKFDDVMRQVGATSGATKEELRNLTELAKDMGASTRFSATQAAEGLKSMSLSGLSANQQMTALPKVLELAAAGSVDLETAAGIATAALSQFGLEATDLTTVNDILVTVFTNSATNIQDLGLAMQYAGPVAKAAGDTFQETATVLALLAKNGFSGEKAGTALRAAYARLLKPVAMAEEAIKRLGLEMRDASGQLLPMTQILRNLKNTGADAADMIQIFGVEAAPALTSAVGMSSQAFDELVSKFNEVSGVSARVAKEMEAGMGGSLRSLEAAWEGVKIAVGEAIDQQSSMKLDELIQAINENKDAIVELALAGVDLGVMLAKVALAVGQFLLEWKEVIVVLGTAAIAVKTVSTATRVLVAIQGAQWFLAGSQAAATFAAAVGTQGLVSALVLARTRLLALMATNITAFFFSGATGARGLALALGRFGLVGAATAAVGTLGYLAYQWYQTKKAEDAAAESTQLATATQGQLAARLKEISAQLGINIPDMETFNRLQKEGVIIADEAVGGWRLATKVVTDGLRQQRQEAQQTAQKLQDLARQRQAAQRNLADLEQQLADEQKKLARETLTEKIRTAEQAVQAKKRTLQQSLEAEKRLAAEILSLEEKKRTTQMSTEDKIRALRERNMSQRQIETSRATAAYQKLQAARLILSQSTLSEQDAQWAEKLARQAQDAFAGLKNTGNAMKGVKASGEVLDALYEKQRQAALQAQEKQKKESASLERQLKRATGYVDRLRKALAAIPEKSTKRVELKTQVKQAQEALASIKEKLAAIQDKTVTVTVRTVEAKAGGGIAGLARGGRLPGYGGGDRIPALLEAGEIVIRKERSRVFRDLLLAINSAPMETVRKIIPQVPRFQAGGLVDALRIPAIPSLALAGGGQVSQPPVEGVVRLDLTMNGRPAASITSPRQQVRQLVDALKEMQRGTL